MFYMDLGRIQKWYSIALSIFQNQRKFRSAQNQSFNTLFIFHSIHNSHQMLARFRKEYARDQFVQVFIMNVILLIWRWHRQFNSCPGKYVWIESSLHGEAETKQPDPFQTKSLSFLASNLHNADERNRRLNLNIIKNNMRRIGG